jgi:hypothetical protein
MTRNQESVFISECFQQASMRSRSWTTQGAWMEHSACYPAMKLKFIYDIVGGCYFLNRWHCLNKATWVCILFDKDLQFNPTWVCNGGYAR